MTREEELCDIRAELKALSSPDIWDQPAESCDEKTTLRRRRWAYLEDRLNSLKQEDQSAVWEKEGDKQSRISGKIILLNPPDPEPGKPYFTIKPTGFSGPWKAGETIKIPMPKRPTHDNKNS